MSRQFQRPLPTILYLAESFPFKLTSGYQIRVAASILALTHHSRVQLLSFHDQPLSRTQATQAIKQFASSLSPKIRNQFLTRLQFSLVYLPTIHKPISHRWREWLGSWLTQEPFLVWQYRSPEFHQKLHQLITTIQPESIHFSHLRLAAYLTSYLEQSLKPLSHLPARPRLIYEAQNVERLLAKSFADFLPRWGRWHWWWRREQDLIKTFETWVVSHVDQVLTLSQVDTEALQQLQAKNILTLPIVYPPNGATKLPRLPALPESASALKLLFVGNLNWLPNADAVRWFLREIWPTVALAHPTVELLIVGEPCSYFSLQPTVAQDRVKFLGFVADLGPILSACHISLLPFRMGSGVRLKALTAAWAGHAIVSTPLGIQGLELESGKNCLVGTTAATFSQQLLALLAHPTQITTLGQAAQTYVSTHHSTQTVKNPGKD